MAGLKKLWNQFLFLRFNREMERYKASQAGTSIEEHVGQKQVKVYEELCREHWTTGNVQLPLPPTFLQLGTKQKVLNLKNLN